MPFSRSRSIESMTRSSTSWLARNAPDCHSIASTSVVLPWSTWAMIATLRRSSRRGMAATDGRRSACGASSSTARTASSRSSPPNGFSTNAVAAVVARGLDDVVLRVAGDEHDRQAGAARARSSSASSRPLIPGITTSVTQHVDRRRGARARERLAAVGRAAAPRSRRRQDAARSARAPPACPRRPAPSRRRRRGSPARLAARRGAGRRAAGRCDADGRARARARIELDLPARAA